MKTNTRKKVIAEYTAGGHGARASTISNEMKLRRVVLTNLLWEDQAYASGDETADNIANLITKVAPAKVVEIAVSARNDQYLRHVPLYIASEMCKHKEYKGYVRELLTEVIQRADEICEFLSIYWKGTDRHKRPLANSARKGLIDALRKFDEYQLAKYKGKDNDISLKDAICILHPNPLTKSQANLWKKVVNESLKTPDTWEVELSKSTNKKDSWTRLLTENKLGGLALLRNIRNITIANVDDDLVVESIKKNNFNKVLPFRFLSALKYGTRYTKELEKAMLNAIDSSTKLKGKTVVIVDVSGSMGMNLSNKSELSRMDAAIALAIILKNKCEDIDIWCTAGYDHRRAHNTAMIESPARGLGLKTQIHELSNKLGGGGIFLKQCTEFTGTFYNNEAIERVIIISDSQDTDLSTAQGVSNASVYSENNYLIDIASHLNGVGYGPYTVINGFSEKVIEFIELYEQLKYSN